MNKLGIKLPINNLEFLDQEDTLMVDVVEHSLDEKAYRIWMISLNQMVDP